MTADIEIDPNHLAPVRNFDVEKKKDIAMIVVSILLLLLGMYMFSKQANKTIPSIVIVIGLVCVVMSVRYSRQVQMLVYNSQEN
jgi:protein-S-isoprenylcysteine O-methyltransferase Ste14